MQKTRKEELLAEMKALDGRTRSVMDSFCNVERLRSYIIRDTFNGVESEKKRSHTMKDVIKFYETEAELHVLDLKSELEDFCRSVKEFNAERDSLWQATRTETKFMLKLINYVQSHNARVLFHQTLKAGDVKRSFDAILVTQDFVMIFKLHEPFHDVCITEEGMYSWYDVYDNRMDQRDEYSRFEDRKDLLQTLLGPDKLDGKRFIYSVVWKSKYRFVNKDRRIECIPLGKLDTWLDSIEMGKTSDSDLDDIALRIERAQTRDSHYPTIHPIVESYAALRNAYEEGKKDSRK